VPRLDGNRRGTAPADWHHSRGDLEPTSQGDPKVYCETPETGHTVACSSEPGRRVRPLLEPGLLEHVVDRRLDLGVAVAGVPAARRHGLEAVFRVLV